MRVAVDKNDNTKTFYIHSGESEPTGVVEGIHTVEEGDVCINTDTKAIKMFNGTSWADWS